MDNGFIVSIFGIVSGLLLWGIKALISAVYENTMAIKVLTNRMEEIVRRTNRIPHLEKEILESKIELERLRHELA